MKRLALLTLTLLFTAVSNAALIVYDDGSTSDSLSVTSTNVTGINGVVIDGQIYDVLFTLDTFENRYGDAPNYTPLYNTTEASDIQFLITGIFNGSNPQSPFDNSAQGTLTSAIPRSVLGFTEFHVADTFRYFYDGYGFKWDWGSKQGILTPSGFNTLFWSNYTAGALDLNETFVFAELVPPSTTDSDNNSDSNPIDAPATYGILAFALFTLMWKRRKP